MKSIPVWTVDKGAVLGCSSLRPAIGKALLPPSNQPCFERLDSDQTNVARTPCLGRLEFVEEEFRTEESAKDDSTDAMEGPFDAEKTTPTAKPGRCFGA